MTGPTHDSNFPNFPQRFLGLFIVFNLFVPREPTFNSSPAGQELFKILRKKLHDACRKNIENICQLQHFCVHFLVHSSIFFRAKSELWDVAKRNCMHHNRETRFFFFRRALRARVRWYFSSYLHYHIHNFALKPNKVIGGYDRSTSSTVKCTQAKLWRENEKYH